jgi:ankyrin repeat protein
MADTDDTPDYLSQLALAVTDPKTVRRLIDNGTKVTPDAIYAAILTNNYVLQSGKALFAETNTDQSLELMLDVPGTDPNQRLDGADNTFLTVKDDWARGDPSTPREFAKSRREWYALYCAATGNMWSSVEAERQYRTRLQNTLLKNGADPYALFRQPLLPSRPYLGFPGVIKKTHYGRDGTERFLIDQKDKCEISNYDLSMINNPHLAKARSEEPLNPDDIFDQNGVRSVIHALLEDGGFVKPILVWPGLDLERRDPQGRTLFLSACRSPMGADATVDGMVNDIAWDPNVGKYQHNCFPQPDHPIEGITTTTNTTTLLQHLFYHGANIRAVDNYGKNALFQLMEASNSDYGRIPVVCYSVKFLANNAPELFNQPDNAGNYPLHAALRRHSISTSCGASAFAAHMATSIDDVLAAGADPNTRDELGNNALHYLANDALKNEDLMRNQKRLFRLFLDKSVDVNEKNHSGISALDMMSKMDQRLLRVLQLPWHLFQEEEASVPNRSDLLKRKKK